MVLLKDEKNTIDEICNQQGKWKQKKALVHKIRKWQFKFLEHKEERERLKNLTPTGFPEGNRGRVKQ